MALSLLTKELARLLKYLGHLSQITLGLLAGTATRSASQPPPPPAHEWLAGGSEALWRLETQFLSEKDPVRRQHLLSIANGMEVS